MSLELVIQENTRAITALVDILSKGAAPAPAPAPKLNVKPAEPDVKDEPAPAEKSKPAEELKAPTYEEASSAITAVIKAQGTPAAKAVLKEFGVSNLKQLDKARYAEIIEAAWKVALS